MKYRAKATFEAYQITQKKAVNRFHDKPDWFAKLLQLDENGKSRIYLANEIKQDEQFEGMLVYNNPAPTLIPWDSYLCYVNENGHELLGHIPKEEFENTYEPVVSA